MRFFTILGILSVALSISGTAAGQTYQYERDMPIALGRSWHPLEPFQPGSLSQCFTTTSPSAPPSGATEFTEGFTETIQELRRITQLRTSVSGSTSFGIARVSGSAEYERYRDIFSSDRSLVYVVTFRRTYQPHAIESAELNVTGAAALDLAGRETDPQQFYRRCGEALITSITRETSLSLVYTFIASSREKREEIRAAISASVATPAASGQGSVNIVNIAQSRDSSVVAEARGYQNGIRDTSPNLSAIIGGATGDLTAIREGLRGAVAAVRWADAPIVRFTAVDISDYFDVPAYSQADYVTRAYASLELLKNYADRYVDRYLELDQLEQDVRSGRYEFRPGMAAQVRAEKQQMLAGIERLIGAARLCFDSPDAECRTSEPDVDHGVLRFVEVDLGEFLRWNYQISNNHYDAGGERINAIATFWPTVRLSNLRFVREIRLYRDDALLFSISDDQVAANAENGIFSSADVWRETGRTAHYCWRGAWTDCNAEAADQRTLVNRYLRNVDGSATYRLVIYDVEGGEEEEVFGSIQNTNF